MYPNNESANLIRPIKMVDDPLFIPVDDWIPMNANEIVWKSAKGVIVLPCSEYFGMYNTAIDYFDISIKRCYNNDDVRNHIVHYLNYFTRFYDEDRELIATYARIKYLIDIVKTYDVDAFYDDINRYILHGSIAHKIQFMDMQNYALNMNSYKHNKSPNLQYTDRHASILYQISLYMVAIIPLLTHFAKANKVDDIDSFLLESYDLILNLYTDVNIYAKLYETVSTTVHTQVSKNQPLWDMQDIRGINPRTHTIHTIENILLNILPKYVYNQNIVIFNYKSILSNIGYQVVDIDYEFNFSSLSTSDRDEDNNSEFDRFESYLTKRDESLYIMNKVNCEKTMFILERIYGPFDVNELNFFVRNNTDENNIFMINHFQKALVFNIFYKYFGDPESIKAINKEDYIKLMLIGKKILQANHMVILPYILSSKVIRINQRKNLNKKELTKLESSPIYQEIRIKYQNEKMEKDIQQLIATTLSSEFEILSYDEPNLNGRKIEMIPDIVMEEICIMVASV